MGGVCLFLNMLSTKQEWSVRLLEIITLLKPNVSRCMYVCMYRLILE